MNIYGIANHQNEEPIIRLGEGLPDLLALGQRDEVLPVFGSEAALRAFVRAHPWLGEDGSERVEPALLGASFIEVAELISPAVEAGGIELVVFDPVLDINGAWVGESLSWPAENFCASMTVVADIARRQEGVPADHQPSPKAVRKATAWYVMRLLLYRLDLLGPFDSLRGYLGLRA